MKTLPKVMRNQIFAAVQAAGLGPEEFVWDDAADDICLRHRSSGAYFEFGGDFGSHVGRYVAGDDPAVELPAYTWLTQMQRVETWLAAVKRDTETPDLWGELLRSTELLGRASDEALENTPFTPDERDEIARQLKQLNVYVKGTYSSLNHRQQIWTHGSTTSSTLPIASAGRTG